MRHAESVSGQTRIQTQPVLLKTQASQFSSFNLHSPSQRLSTSVQLYCGGLVWEKGVEVESLSLAWQGPPPQAAHTALGCLKHYLLPLCLQTALLIQPWEVFALAALLTPCVDTSPGCSSSHPRCNPGSWG